MSWNTGLVYKEFSQVVINNTTTKTEVFSFVIPGGMLEEGNLLEIAVNNVVGQGTGSVQSFQPSVEYTTSSGVVAEGVAGHEIGPGTSQSRFILEILPKNDTSIISTFQNRQGDTAVANNQPQYLHSQELNVDFSENITVKIYVALGTASSNFTWTKNNSRVLFL